MTPADFAAKWERVTTSERASAQSHFLDLCELLEVDKPLDVDPTGTGVVALFRPPPSKVLLGWASRVVLVVLIGALAATGWPEFVSALEGWRALF